MADLTSTTGEDDHAAAGRRDVTETRRQLLHAATDDVAAAKQFHGRN